MAFQARRDKMGKLVDRQDLSGRRQNLHEMSDEDSIAGSNRSGAPTVRFLGRKKVVMDAETNSDEEQDTDTLSHTLVGHQKAGDFDKFLNGDSDSISKFCQELEEEEARERLAGLALDADDVESLLNCYKDSPRPNGEGGLEEDSQSVCSCESGTLGRAESIGDFCDILNPTFIPEKHISVDRSHKHKPHRDADSASLSSYNSCSLGSDSGRSYIRRNATEEDMRLLEASSGRELMTSRTYNMDASSQSTCSWNRAYGPAFQASEGRSNYLPTLSLISRDSECSTFYKSLEETKERDSLNFEKWKQHKADQMQKKLLAAKREREQRQREMAERAEKSKKKFDEWCLRKEQQKLREKKSLFHVNQTTRGGSQRPATLRKETPEEAKERIKEWERRKMEQLQRERDRLRREREQRVEEEKKRIELAEAAYTKWMETIESRPMPVPLNQGFATLRGTVSDIFINPNKWESSTDPLEDDRCL
ncbi:stress response protein NST1 [Drosophila miranda]|uniref:stress response protein NST1 n=1 Tax=Drosophila miranda TaxID=7229 RepID=UPI0007E86909|nr:stress response protein NST1 [Drosophila miranda]XP_017155381.1 stress response protein NST1 [Drosophila miranda]XP_017155382.1 stress response protein NST1 [Drosophila miranda]